METLIRNTGQRTLRKELEVAGTELQPRRGYPAVSPVFHLSVLRRKLNVTELFG